MTVQKGPLSAYGEARISGKRARLNLQVEIDVGIQAELLRLSPQLVLRGSERLSEKGTHFEGCFRNDVASHARAFQRQPEITLQETRGARHEIVDLGLSRFPPNRRFQAFQCAMKFRTILLQCLRLALPPPASIH